MLLHRDFPKVNFSAYSAHRTAMNLELLGVSTCQGAAQLILLGGIASNRRKVPGSLHR